MSQGFARHFGLPLRILVKYASILPVSDLGLAQISRTACTCFYLLITCFLIVLSGLTWKKNNQTQQKCLSVPSHKAKHLENGVLEPYGMHCNTIKDIIDIFISIGKNIHILLKGRHYDEHCKALSLWTSHPGSACVHNVTLEEIL